MIDLAAIYRESRERLSELAGGLSEEQRATTVPACPAWSVKDLYAHLAGIAADLAAGTLERAGTDEETARQVAERSGMSLEEILAEWSQTGPAVESILESAPMLGTPVIDLWTHEQDLRGALGLEGHRGGGGLTLTQKAASQIKHRVRAAGLPAIRAIVGDDDRILGDGEPGITVRAEPYEWARVVMGRRSRAQMAALDWDGDPGPYLDLLTVFSPPETDLVD